MFIIIRVHSHKLWLCRCLSLSLSLPVNLYTLCSLRFAVVLAQHGSVIFVPQNQPIAGGQS